jgi:Tol biopolymer transport system component
MRLAPSIVGALLVLVVGSAHAASRAPTPGTWIVFSAFPNGLPPAQLFRVSTSNDGLQQLTNGKYTTTQPAFSPSGTRIVFTRLGSGIFVMNLDGSAVRRLTSGHHDLFPVFSPNGKQIAFTRQVKSNWRLFVMSASGTHLRRLPQAPPSGRPSWTADGKSIYIPAQGAFARVDAHTGRVQRHVTLSMDAANATTFSPDSKQAMFLGSRPSIPNCGEVSCIVFALYRVDVKTGKVRKFLNDAGPAGWSSDGKQLVFVYRRGIVLWPLAGGAQTTLSTGADVAQADAPPAWQPR